MIPSRYVNCYNFGYLCDIKPDVDERGLIKQYKPQPLYKNISGYPLNKYGKGTFCKFRVPNNISISGVYAIYVDDDLKYIGECVDLSDRFNTGYGQISPRNCYLGGQETNCRINKIILREASRNKRISLYFYKTKKHKLVEREILGQFKPSWNK